jgi:hypothetical protein
MAIIAAVDIRIAVIRRSYQVLRPGPRRDSSSGAAQFVILSDTPYVMLSTDRSS